MLVAACGIPDILQLIIRTYSKRLTMIFPGIMHFNMEHMTVSFLHFQNMNKFQISTIINDVGVWHFSLVASYGLVMLAINRLTAVWYPLHYEVMWTKSKLALCIVSYQSHKTTLFDK